jgi:tRNA-splicing ligase RtcB
MPVTVIGEHEERTIQQLERCVQAEDGAVGVLCADGHVGYSQPVGGAVAYRDHISVSGVGYDIGCGNKAVRTDLHHEDVGSDLPRIMDAIVKRISFGIGRHNDEPVDHPVLDAIRTADAAPQRALAELAVRQLGTVGAGNHYVDLFADEEGLVWVGVHFGSRGFGHRTASTYLALAGEAKGGMDAPPSLLAVDSELGQEYIAAMKLAGEYAHAGRDAVVARVLDILGAAETFSVHNHHNFAWREAHGGEDWWVVRKGCTPAFPGQQGFVGSTMGEQSVILEGADTPQARASFFSTVHGAGRRMSRTQAKGRKGRPGLIDFRRVQADLRERGIELRGGAADEAPDAYKRLDEVLADHGDSIRVLHRLTPIGVAMAGADTFDPYKD